jgi:hypothetical protein
VSHQSLVSLDFYVDFYLHVAVVIIATKFQIPGSTLIYPIFILSVLIAQHQCARHWVIKIPQNKSYMQPGTLPSLFSVVSLVPRREASTYQVFMK